MAKRRRHVITLVYSVQRPPCTWFHNETSDIANGNLGTRATLNFAQTRPHCEAEFASSRCRWTRKPLRHLCTQTVKSCSKQFCSVQRPTLNWQTRPLTKQISTFPHCPRTKKTFSHLWSEAREAQTIQFCSAHRTTLVV